jgi:hypothetical protein
MMSDELLNDEFADDGRVYPRISRINTDYMFATRLI